LSAGAEAGEFQTKGRVERKRERSSDLVRGREKEAAGSTNQPVEQAKHKPYFFSTGKRLSCAVATASLFVVQVFNVI